MNGFHVSASGAIQGHHGPLVNYSHKGKNDPELQYIENFRKSTDLTLQGLGIPNVACRVM